MKDTPNATRVDVVNRAPWGAAMRYSRAVRVGDVIEVSGTTSVDDLGSVTGVGDMRAQVLRCFSIIESALQDLGATLADVVRTRVYVTDMAGWPLAGAAHDEVFADLPAPASSAIGVSQFVHPDLMVEIEATAIISGGRNA